MVGFEDIDSDRSGSVAFVVKLTIVVGFEDIDSH